MLSLIKKSYQIFQKCEDYIFSADFLSKTFFLFLLFLACLIRYLATDFQSGDYGSFLSPWYDYIVQNGGYLALKDNFANYTPTYLYLLTLVTYLPLPKIAAIKIISIFFDFLLALVVFRIVTLIIQIKENAKIVSSSLPNNSIQNSILDSEKKLAENSQNILKADIINNSTDNSNSQNISVSPEFPKFFFKTKTPQASKFPKINLPIIAFFIILFSPTVVFNSAVWAQCDVIYTTFLILAFLNVLKSRYLWTFFWFAIALSFKLQAVFLIPIFLILFLLRKVNIFYFLFLPLVYVLTILPSWLIGRNFVELLRIYADQGNTYQSLTMNSPTFYHWFGGGNYEILVKIGLVLAVLNIVVICYIFWVRGFFLILSDTVSSNLQNLANFTNTSKIKSWDTTDYDSSSNTLENKFIVKIPNLPKSQSKKLQNIFHSFLDLTAKIFKLVPRAKLSQSEISQSVVFDSPNDLNFSQNPPQNTQKLDSFTPKNKFSKLWFSKKIKPPEIKNPPLMSLRMLEFWFDLALLSSISIPYFLPKMHERYFFVADIVSILYAFWRPSHFWVAIIINLISFFAYGPFLLGTKAFDFSFLSLVLFVLIVYLFTQNIRKITQN